MSEWRNSRSQRSKVVIAAAAPTAAAAGVVVVAYLAASGTNLSAAGITAFLHGAGIAGPAALTVLQVLLVLSGFLPASLMAVVAGAVYGLAAGFALAGVGTMLGAVIAFGLSRSLLRSHIERRLARRDRLRRLDAAVAQERWKLVCLLRLSPVMPFSATSFMLGLSSVGLGDYVVGTLAALPALFGYVLLGYASSAGVAAALSGEEAGLHWILLGVGAAATLLLAGRLGQVVQHELSPRSAEALDGSHG